ncbi:MAG: NUDIX hydrolase [Acidimicrobiales bacterium]
MTATRGSGFRKLGERELHRGHVISLAEGYFEAPDGTRVSRDLVHHPGAVAVVPLDGDEVVLVRQYRAAIDAEVLEIPAGKRDVPTEPPERTAVRELEEEVGFTTGALVPLARFYNSIGFCDEYSHLYLATDLEPVPTDRQGVEEQSMTIERVALVDAPGLIAAGHIEDAKTIIGLLATLRHIGR